MLERARAPGTDADLVVMDEQIRAGSVLPAMREPLELVTSDGLCLVGELALPVKGEVRATLVCVHPLPTHGGMMDSHLLRKAAWRLPALAGIAVLRFNTRGTSSAAGTSDGHFDNGDGEGLDLRAAIDYVMDRQLPSPWLLGWSFGTDVVLRHGDVPGVRGAILVSPPLRSATVNDLQRWSASGLPVVCLIPEFDDYLRPDEARAAFAPLVQARLDVGEGAGHLWVGERYARMVLDAVADTLCPGAAPLPQAWSAQQAVDQGPMERWSDL